MNMKLPSFDLAALTGAWWVKPLVYLAIGLVAFLSLRAFGADIKRKLFGDPEVIRARAEAVAQAERAEGVSRAAQGSMDVVVRVQQQRQAIDATTVRNDHAIKQALGSGDQAPGVGAALDRALCLRDAYRGEPDCAPLQGAR
jgi:hypothetical protein